MACLPAPRAINRTMFLGQCCRYRYRRSLPYMFREYRRRLFEYNNTTKSGTQTACPKSKSQPLPSLCPSTPYTQTSWCIPTLQGGGKRSRSKTVLEARLSNKTPKSHMSETYRTHHTITYFVSLVHRHLASAAFRVGPFSGQRVHLQLPRTQSNPA